MLARICIELTHTVWTVNFIKKVYVCTYTANMKIESMNHGSACKSTVYCSYSKCNKSKLERNKKSGLDWLCCLVGNR